MADDFDLTPAIRAAERAAYDAVHDAPESLDIATIVDIAVAAALPVYRKALAQHVEGTCEPLDRTAFREGAEWAAALVRGGTTGGES